MPAPPTNVVGSMMNERIFGARTTKLAGALLRDVLAITVTFWSIETGWVDIVKVTESEFAGTFTISGTDAAADLVLTGTKNG